MNKSTKILRSVAFVILALIAAGLFDVFTAWAMSRLDPMAQETVGLVNAPWGAVYPTRRLVARRCWHRRRSGHLRQGHDHRLDR